ncbi:MAG TPA: DUF6600 domain-containing protein [Terriglobales bacterium]|nr:DUF6600 domain-containing protein [Terriglobales bacterium]
MKILRRFACAMSVVVLACFSMAAQADSDPPGRAVEISYMSGQVSVQPGGVNDWVAATVNRPLSSADRVWADQNSRAELNLGAALLRVDSETSVTLLNVDDQTAQIELDQGALNLHLVRLDDGQIYEVDTPNLAFTVSKPGDYRFDVDPNNDTTMVTVWKGEGEATGQGNAVRIRSGERASFNNGTSLEHQISGAPGPDGFDDWCRVRDQRLDRSASLRYVSPDMVGYEELDDYGSWRQVPTYGAIWVPAHVEPGWAPYRYGHWVWVEPWGWTWVDDAAWGFAPSHYGRWVYTGGYWGWVPGPVAVRPVYAPALVAWVGGNNWAVGVSFGGGVGVGWFPLGYNEPYVPAYHVSRGYFDRVNISNTRITNVTVINNYYNNSASITRINYVNRRVPGAMTAVSTSVMVNSQPVGHSFVRLPAGAAERGQVGAVVPVAPTRTSVLGIHAGVTARAPARTNFRPVVTHTAPPPRPVPFEAKQQELQRNPGRPLDAQQVSQIRARMPVPNRPQAPNANANRTEQAPNRPQAPNANANRTEQAPNRPQTPNANGNRTEQAPNRPQTPNANGNRTEQAPPAPTANRNNNGNPNERNIPRPPERGNMSQPENRPNAPERVVPRPPERGQENRPQSAQPNPEHQPATRPNTPEAPRNEPQAQPPQRQQQPPQGEVRPEMPNRRVQPPAEQRNTPQQRENTPRPPQGEERRNEARPPERQAPRPPERKQESKPENKNESKPDHHDHDRGSLQPQRSHHAG